MRFINKFSAFAIITVAIMLGLAGPLSALAASSPSLGTAGTFGILSSTYTNTAGGTTITGDLGYTTGPAVAPTVSGTTHVADSTYNSAGIDQNAALTNLNNQSCTSLGTGAVALNAIDIGSGPGVFTPGCYSSGGAMNITLSTTVTLNGAGTYIFRPAGALTTGADSIVAFAGGATECDVFWTPTGATTLGANSTFKGTVIDAAGITIGSTVGWDGRALAFGGTVSTVGDTITVPTCTATAGILRVVKTVINDSGRTATAGDFNLHVRLSGTDVAGSPTVGTATPGTSYSVAPGAYAVREDAVDNYSQTFSGSCDSSGNVTIVAGDDKTCTITNNDNAPVVASSVSGTGTGSANNVNIHVVKTAVPSILSSGPGSVTFTYKVTTLSDMSLGNVSATDNKCSPVRFVSGDTNNDSRLDRTETWTYNCTKVVSENETNIVTARGTANGSDVQDTDTANVVVSSPVPVPGLPNTGFDPEEQHSSWNIIIMSCIFLLVSTSLVQFLRKSTI